MGNIIDLGTSNWSSIMYDKDYIHERFTLEELMEKAAKRLKSFPESNQRKAELAIIGVGDFNAYILNKPSEEAIARTAASFSILHPSLSGGLRALSTERVPHHKIENVYIYDVRKMGSPSVCDHEIFSADNHNHRHSRRKAYMLFPNYITIEPTQLYAFMHELKECDMLNLGGPNTIRSKLYNSLCGTSSK